MDEKEMLILSHFRRDARKNLTKISRNTGIPVSTIFDKLRKYEGGIIKRHTALIDFDKIGYDVRVQLILKVHKENKQELENFLMMHRTVNNFYRINNGFDFMVEALFKTINEYYTFSEEIESIGIQKQNEFFVLQELRKEAFLTGVNPLNQ